MADYYLVRLEHGPAWDHSRPIRKQDGWDEHAAFMDSLVDQGIIILGGPIDEGEETFHILDLDSETAIKQVLAADPWAGDRLRIKSIEPWWVWLRASWVSPPAFRD